MTDTPDEWTEAAARILMAQYITEYEWHGGWEEFARDASEVVEAVFPLIAAYVANQIADAQADMKWHHLGNDDYAAGMEAAKEDLLAVARGWSP
jgi:hypothetical protein